MDLDPAIRLIEDALQTSLENGIRAVRDGEPEKALESLERGYAKVSSALDFLRTYHRPPDWS
jgi:hypothetical protein